MCRYINLIFLSVLLIFLIYNNPTFAATYYVKDNNCSDSNNGTEPSPWCHCPGMPSWEGSATLKAGDIVYFDSAGIWTEISGTAVLDITGGVTYIGDTWGSGTRAKLIAGGSMSSQNVVRFYDDDDTYETEVQGFDIDAGGDTSVCTGCPRPAGCYHNNGIGMYHPGYVYAHLTGATKRIENCVVHDTFSCVSNSEYNYGIIIRSQGGYQVDDVEILDTVVYDQSRSCFNLYPYKDSQSNLVSNITVRGCECYNTALDPGYNSGNGLMVKNEVLNAYLEYNYIHDMGGTQGNCAMLNSDRSLTNGPRNIHFRYNIFRNCSADAVHIRQEESGSGSTIEGKIYGNIIHANTNAYNIKLDSSNSSGSVNLLIYNNSMYDEGIFIDNIGATVTTLEVKNNIFHSTSGFVPLTDSGGKITAHNNNIYYRVGGGTFVRSGGNSYTSSNLSSYELTALSSDPKFVNTSNLPTGFIGIYGVDKRPNTDGLSLQSNSPAIDSGANLGSPYNNSINSISRPFGADWDRGAYEIGIQDTIPPAPPLNLQAD